jgi:hypothetical protein
VTYCDRALRSHHRHGVQERHERTLEVAHTLFAQNVHIRCRLHTTTSTREGQARKGQGRHATYCAGPRHVLSVDRVVDVVIRPIESGPAHQRLSLGRHSHSSVCREGEGQGQSAASPVSVSSSKHELPFMCTYQNLVFSGPVTVFSISITGNSSGTLVQAGVMACHLAQDGARVRACLLAGA